ncbi:MAG: penicillin-binding protein [Bacteroidota bacterium]
MAGTLIKNEVLLRVYIVLGVLVLVAMFVFFQAVKINVQDGERLRTTGETFIKEMYVKAERGNVMTEEGELIATSLPVFDIAFDPNSRGMTQEDFDLNIDSLANRLAPHVDLAFTSGGLRNYLQQKRKEALVQNVEEPDMAVTLQQYFKQKRADSTQFVMIKKGVSIAEKEQIEQYPLFNKGQFRGGLIATPRFMRARPYGILAQRTIGYVRPNITPVGLEGKFDNILSGEAEKQVMRLVDPVENLWIPAGEFDAIQLERGADLVTTLDIDLQEITETALLRALNYHDAEWGTAIVMEVKTGKIRSIANLGRTDKGWWETYNFAIGRAVEPGSIFKLASIMTLLEDGLVSLEDSVFLNKGVTEYYGEEMRDSYRHSLDSSTVRRAFEISSNVGISSLVTQYYGQKDKQDNFLKRLKSFKLHLKNNIEINGEAPPVLKEVEQWSGTTLPWMSIGYEVQVTPLQMLTLYNAVANNGMMMKPYLVTEIQHHGETQKVFKPTMLSQSIASRKTIAQAQQLLEGVVLRGTADDLKTSRYNFAGKTGTAQVDYRRVRGRTRVGGYQASFAGYFPAERPLYSCIVIINKPSRGQIYGGEVAGPVFREIADKTFASKIDMHEAVNSGQAQYASMPDKSIGAKGDINYLLNELGLPHYGGTRSNWAVLEETEDRDSLIVKTRYMKEDVVPNVVGLGLRDALFVLENAGLKTKVSGVGKVVEQSIRSGTPITGERTITIRLR